MYEVSSVWPLSETISLNTPFSVPSIDAPLSPISQRTSVLSY